MPGTRPGGGQTLRPSNPLRRKAFVDATRTPKYTVCQRFGEFISKPVRLLASIALERPIFRLPCREGFERLSCKCCYPEGKRLWLASLRYDSSVFGPFFLRCVAGVSWRMTLLSGFPAVTILVFPQSR